jgi:ABC-type phosphate/phosphonate transport system permease subunit
VDGRTYRVRDLPDKQEAANLMAKVRAAKVLVIGAGGIGFELIAALRLISYDQVAAILITILACVVVVDSLGAMLRKRLK